jgi:hypothetical protein
MKTQHRFLRVHHGIPSFASVEIEASQNSPNGFQITEQLSDHPHVDAGEINRASEATWVDAALSGIRDTATVAQSCGVSLAAWHISLLKVVGTTMDTREDAVRCAAMLATMEAIASAGTLPAGTVIHDGSQWLVQYPVPV